MATSFPESYVTFWSRGVDVAKDSYLPRLQKSFESLIEKTELDERQRDFLRSRWLDQVIWMEGRAITAQRRFYRLRMITVAGAVLVPALVSLTTLDDWHGQAAKIVLWIVSLVVAVSAAVEGFFQFGLRWRNYRGTVERLKMEGWLYLQTTGPYAGTAPSESYGVFAARVEELIRSDVDVYLTEVAIERKNQEGSPAA
jgi:hypothetical protein